MLVRPCFIICIKSLFVKYFLKIVIYKSKVYYFLDGLHFKRNIPGGDSLSGFLQFSEGEKPDRESPPGIILFSQKPYRHPLQRR